MHGTFEELRAAHPGKWLLIRLDHRESESGTLLFVDKDPDRVDEALLRQPKESGKERPLYVTYSESEDGDDHLPVVATPFLL